MLTEEELVRTEDMGDYYKVHPWWNKTTFGHIDNEYSSGDNVVNKDQIKQLIARADKEFEILEMPGGEFSNF